MLLSFKLPLKAFRFDNDIFDHMTLKSWFSCRPESNVVKDFLKELNSRLNGVSSRQLIWYSNGADRCGNLIIKLETTYTDISMSQFKSIVQSEIIPRIKEFSICNDRLSLNDSFEMFDFRMVS